MITEMSKGWKLIRYGYGFKMNLAIGLFCSLLSILVFYVGKSGWMMGTLYALLTPTMLLQIVSSLLFSGMAAASPRRKLLELYFPDLMTVITGLLGYIVVLGMSLFWVNTGRETVEDCIEVMLVSSALTAVVLIYFGAAYKYFVISTILFMVGMLFGISMGLFLMRLIGQYLTMLSTSLVCIGIIAVGVLISCWLRRIFYKKPVSPWSVGMSLRKAMQ